MHHTTFMGCCRRVSPMGGGERHDPRTPLTVASSQQFVCNSSSSLLYTDLGKTTGMLMASHALRLHHVDSALALTAHRPSYYTTIQTNHLILSQPVAMRTLIWCRFSWERIGLPDWTMICHNRPQSREMHFVFQPFRERTQCASHYIHGLLQTSFPHGRR